MMFRKKLFLLLLVFGTVSLLAFAYGCGSKPQDIKMIAEQKAALQSAQDRISAIEDSIRQCQSNLGGSMDRISSLTAEKTRLSSSIDSLATSISNLDMEKSNLSSQIATERSDKEVAMKKAKTQEGQILSLRRETSRQKEMLAMKSAQMDSLNAVETQLNDQITQNQTQITTLQSQKDSLSAQMTLTMAEKDSKYKTMLILFVVALAAFIIALIWAIVKK